jgi:hypothetical protein
MTWFGKEVPDGTITLCGNSLVIVPSVNGFFHFLPGMFFRVAVRRMMILDTRAWRWPISTRIGMNIGGAVHPRAAPGRSADDNGVRAPGKSRP